MRNMVILRSVAKTAKITLIDMNLKEVRLSFKRGIFVGVGDGLLYFHADEVLDTNIADTPSEYINPDPNKYSKERE